MKLIKYLEFKEEDFSPIKSFHIKNELSPKCWHKFAIIDSIRTQLLTIAKDFYNSIEMDANIIDIVLCGSLCNYNWSEKYSDFDLHLIIRYSDVDENIDLVNKTCEYAKKIWNNEHDIKIVGYDVEIYIQDINDLNLSMSSGKMGGVFSLLNNKWIKKPIHVDFKIDEKLILEKSKSIMIEVDDIENKSISDDYKLFDEKITKVWKKIKRYRKSGLESEGGELSIGNLVFKLLRRNGYISKIMKLKRDTYDKKFK